MKKIIFVFTLALITHASPAQKSVYNSQPERLFNQERDVSRRNYTGARTFLKNIFPGAMIGFLKKRQPI